MMMQSLCGFIQVERLRLWRQRSDVATRLGFVLLVITLFPFALGPDKDTLARLAAGLLSLALLFAHMLDGARLYAEDKESGVLDSFVAQRFSLSLYALTRASMQMGAQIVCFLFLLPLLLLLLHVPFERFLPFALSASLGSMVLTWMNMGFSALLLGARRAGMLLPLLLFPLQIPALVFMTTLATEGFSGAGLQAFYFLLAESVFCLCLFPFVAGAGLRAAVEAA